MAHDSLEIHTVEHCVADISIANRITGKNVCDCLFIAPAHLGKLSRVDRGDYSAQFAIRLMNKDFRLILETAAAAKVPMPATAAAFQMNVAEFNESNEEDFSAVITLMERLARLEASDALRNQHRRKE
jgi:hypothetical protein